MLPDRSKRYAGVDGEVVRLQLAGNWQLFLVALLVLVLLKAIFPRKALIEHLYAQQTLDDLTLSYVQNLYRTNPNNADAALLLAKALPNGASINALESLVLGLTTSGDLRQRHEARALLLKAYRTRLDQHPETNELNRLTIHAKNLLKSIGQDPLPDNLASLFGNEAFKLNLPELGLYFFKKLTAEPSSRVLEHQGDLALGNGQHTAAASYYFLAQEHASSISESRRLFQSGIRTLMAASLFVQAMTEAKTRLGDLAQDRSTLRFLSRTALAAGDQVAAADYARRLVFR